MKNIELLSPVGDFDCLRAAVQNGANAVYLGVSDFNARYSATNFNLTDLNKAIDYAKVRNVKVYLTLNTLVKEFELEQVLKIAHQAYSAGIDAVIVQDFGLANLIHKNIPNLPIHGSTQMTIHSLEGAIYLKNLGFKRIVLSRELSLEEIDYISKNSNIETEVFAHGALCISYSGQCLFSSMIGGRSGNRGKCAQGCRLPYELLENTKTIDKGYLLSPKDLCSLDVLPQLISTGITSLKLEGRMKTPEYVATVTRLYRKYINKITHEEPYSIDEQDILDLKQVFNRGGFSSGHLKSVPNRSLIYKEKPNNMGIYLGSVLNYTPNKKYVDLKLETPLNIGDSITFEKESSKYNVSELMINNQNTPSANIGNIVTIGRMIGNISKGDKIYKLSSKELSAKAESTYSGAELKKIKLDCIITIKANTPISIKITSKTNIFFNPCIELASDITPVPSINQPITKERIISQLKKTSSTPFEFENITVDLDDNLFISPISAINELRRKGLEKIEQEIIKSFKHSDSLLPNSEESNLHTLYATSPKISLLLNILKADIDYSNISKIDRLYIPLKYFFENTYKNMLLTLTNKFKTYIYMPSILRKDLSKKFMENINHILQYYQINGFVVSNLGQLELLKDFKDNYELIGNYTLNIFNSLTATNLDLSSVTLSPEINRTELQELTNILRAKNINSELIVYGNLPLMTSNYCLLGKSNKCYKECSMKCQNLKNNSYYLKDRMGFLFRIIPDNIQTISTLYNSKITSIDFNDIGNDYARIDILDENMEEINNIISTIRSGKRLEGENYTNGNINRNV